MQKALAWDTCRGIAVAPFVGTGGPLSRGIYYVLSIKHPLSTRQIYKSVISIPYFKDTLLSTINKKVRKLEEHGYLKKTQTNQKIGGSTNYYELTTRFINRWILDSNTKKELFENKSQETEQIFNLVFKAALQDK
jgi:hypothetical protein